MKISWDYRLFFLFFVHRGVSNNNMNLMKSVINVHTFSLLALLSITRDTRLSLSLSRLHAMSSVDLVNFM